MKSTRRPWTRSVCLLATLPMLTACLSSGSGASNGSGGDATRANAVASCVAPYLNDQPPNGRFRSPAPTVRRGDTLTVYGHWYTSTCNDTGNHDPFHPLPPVHLTLKLPSGRTKHLGEFMPAGQDLGFRVRVRIPAAAGAGTATISDDQPVPARYRFTVMG